MVDEPEEEKELRIEITVSPVDQGHVLLEDIVSIFRREGIAEQIIDAITGQARGRQAGHAMNPLFDALRDGIQGAMGAPAQGQVVARATPPITCQHNYRYVERNDVGQSIYRCTECQDTLTLTGTIERTEEGGDENGRRGEETGGTGGD